MSKRIILFGGTFDPIHLGHTQVAGFAAKYIDAKKVFFIPAKRSPHKKVFPIADPAFRLAMITAAIEEENNFCVSDRELKRPEPSYTLDTINSFRQTCPEGTELYWLVGADAITDLPKWYKLEQLLSLCHLSIMYRAGFEKPDLAGLQQTIAADSLGKLARNIIPAPLIDISSSEIRKRLADKQDVSNMLNPKVLDFIIQNHLYDS